MKNPQMVQAGDQESKFIQIGLCQSAAQVVWRSHPDKRNWEHIESHENPMQSSPSHLFPCWVPWQLDVKRHGTFDLEKSQLSRAFALGRVTPPETFRRNGTNEVSDKTHKVKLKCFSTWSSFRFRLLSDGAPDLGGPSLTVTKSHGHKMRKV